MSLCQLFCSSRGKESGICFVAAIAVRFFGGKVAEIAGKQEGIGKGGMFLNEHADIGKHFIGAGNKTDTAAPEGIANQEKIKSVIELAASGASKREVFMRVMKEFAHIPQKKQTEEDADALIRIVSKSDLVRDPKRLRGKMRLFRKKDQIPNGDA